MYTYTEKCKKYYRKTIGTNRQGYANKESVKSGDIIIRTCFWIYNLF